MADDRCGVTEDRGLVDPAFNADMRWRFAEHARVDVASDGDQNVRMSSAGSLVRLHDRLGDAPAVVHRVAVRPGPLADRGGLLTVRTSRLVLGCGRVWR